MGHKLRIGQLQFPFLRRLLKEKSTMNVHNNNYSNMFHSSCVLFVSLPSNVVRDKPHSFHIHPVLSDALEMML